MTSKKLGIIVGCSAGLIILLCGAALLGFQAGRRHTPVAAQTAGTTVPGLVGLSREKILEMLPGKTWYMHWENQKDKRTPVEFTPIQDGKFRDSVEGRTFTAELRWVLNDGVHFFVPLNETTIKGFFQPNGRPKGFFTEPPSKLSPPPPPVASPEPG